MLLCDATLRVTDPEALAAELDETWSSAPRTTTVPGSGWNTSSPTVYNASAPIWTPGDQLHIHANSENRFERVLTVIRALDPSAAALETRQLPTRSPILETLSGSPPGVLDPGDSPELAAALQEMVRNFEGVLARRGDPGAVRAHPPRVRRRPDRRPDLIRLLDSFPTPARPEP